MNSTHFLQYRRLQPAQYYFKEIVPLCSKNGLENKKPSTSKTACVEELQLLFACLKKWEFDDLPCEKFHNNFMRCIEKDKIEDARLKETYKDAPIDGADTDSNSLTVGQLNKLMKMYPQPDLGKSPYRVMKRLPTQSYADDIFRKKHIKGKPS